MIFSTIEDGASKSGLDISTANLKAVNDQRKALFGKYNGKISFDKDFGESLNKNIGYLQAFKDVVDQNVSVADVRSSYTNEVTGTEKKHFEKEMCQFVERWQP